MRSLDPKATFCRRLREARLAAGLSQKQLGIKAGLDPFVASPRVNRYEVGVHEPDMGMASRLAYAASVPLAYFYADDDRLAQVIKDFKPSGSKLSRKGTAASSRKGKAD
jgi:transcriptional regulator with XRE-family HTH domain